MQEFDYQLAKTIKEALSLLEEEGDGARILCGGTDLIVQLQEGRAKARRLVDVKSIPELNAISYHPTEGLLIGAAVSCYRICHDPQVVNHYPGLVDAVSLIGGVQIQGRASMGGNLCNASPAADSIPALIVHRAVCEVAGPGGMRSVKVEDFCTAPGQNCLKSGEFLTTIHLPPPEPFSGAAYVRFTPRNEMDIGVVGAGAAVELDENLQTILSARLALGAVAPTPLFVSEAGEYLAGRNISTAVIQEAVSIAQKAVRPIADMRGTIAQRKHLAAVLTRRALVRAIQRAGGEYAQ